MSRGYPTRTELQDRQTPRRLLGAVQTAWLKVASALAERLPEGNRREIERRARRTVELLVFDAAVRATESGSVGCHRTEGLAEDWAGWLAAMDTTCGEALTGFEAAEAAQLADDLGGELGLHAFRAIRRGIAAVMPGDVDQLVDWLAAVHGRLLDCHLARRSCGTWYCATNRQGRKRRGVFYTPEPVTRYVARRTLEIAALRPDSVPCFRIFDPACGAGAFLLAAWRAVYPQLARKGKAADVLRMARRIMGVDLDLEAVIAARRALWLWLGTRPVRPELELLADVLAGSVRCANALVEPNEQSAQYDVVLGNPPYRRELGAKQLFDAVAATDLVRYRDPRMDLWHYFVHRGLQRLRDGGALGFVVGAYWTSARGAARLSAALREKSHIEEIFLLEDLPLFDDVSGRHMILLARKGPPKASTLIKHVDSGGKQRPLSAYFDETSGGGSLVHRWHTTPAAMFRGSRVCVRPSAAGLDDLFQGHPALDRLGTVRQGIAENPATINRRTNRRFGNRWPLGAGVFVLTEAELANLELSNDEQCLIRPYHRLCDWDRYRLAKEPSRWLIYATQQTCPSIDRYPRLRRHLEQYRPIMEVRRETRLGRRAWWQLHWPREEAIWLEPKILCRQMSRRPSLVPAEEPVYVSFSANVFIPSTTRREHPFYWAALLNSRLLWCWFAPRAKRRGVGLEINGHLLRQAPLRPVDIENPAERERHDRLVELVDRLLADAETTAADREVIEAELDDLVYQGFGAGREIRGAVERFATGEMSLTASSRQE